MHNVHNLTNYLKHYNCIHEQSMERIKQAKHLHDETFQLQTNGLQILLWFAEPKDHWYNYLNNTGRQENETKRRLPSSGR